VNETEEEDVCSPFPKRRILSSEDAFPEIELDGGTESLNSSISSDLPMKKLKKKGAIFAISYLAGKCKRKAHTRIGQSNQNKNVKNFP
jgi:hypothetical protein